MLASVKQITWSVHILIYSLILRSFCVASERTGIFFFFAAVSAAQTRFKNMRKKMQ